MYSIERLPLINESKYTSRRTSFPQRRHLKSTFRAFRWFRFFILSVGTTLNKMMINEKGMVRCLFVNTNRSQCRSYRPTAFRSVCFCASFSSNLAAASTTRCRGSKESDSSSSPEDSHETVVSLHSEKKNIRPLKHTPGTVNQSINWHIAYATFYNTSKCDFVRHEKTFKTQNWKDWRLDWTKTTKKKK